MTRYARINTQNEIDDIRDLLEQPDPNPTKGWRWLPIVVGEMPSYEARIERAVMNRVVGAKQVAEVWEVVRVPRDDQILAVKAEAQRRIFDRFPQWKQANMTARAVEIVRMGEGNWTPEVKTEADALDGAWAWIKSVRDASNTIEALDPIPSDFSDDARWPS